LGSLLSGWLAVRLETSRREKRGEKKREKVMLARDGLMHGAVSGFFLKEVTCLTFFRSCRFGRSGGLFFL